MEDSYKGVQSQMQAQLSEHTQNMRALTTQMEESEKTDLELTKKVGKEDSIITLLTCLVALCPVCMVQTASLQEDIRALETTITTLQQELHSTRARLQHTTTSLEQQITTLEVHPVIM